MIDYESDNESDNESDYKSGNKNEPKEKHLPIVRLKQTILPGNCKIKEVYENLKSKLESGLIKKKKSEDSVLYDNDSRSHKQKIPNCIAKFSEEKEGKVGDVLYYTTICKLRFSTNSVIPNEKDRVSGTMKFFYWEDDGIKLYASVKSGKSPTWAKISGYRDCKFPKRFAMTFLNPKCMKQTTGFYLTGKTSGVTTSSYAKSDNFDPSDVISKYGVIEKFNAAIINEEIGKLLKEKCNLDASKKYYVRILTGQVNLTVCDYGEYDDNNDRCFKLFQFIDESINNRDLNNETYWKFLTYVQRVYDGKPIEEKVLNELSQLFSGQINESTIIDLGSALVYTHQDIFDHARVSLLYRGETISWKGGSSEWKGENICGKDVLEALKNQIDTKKKNEPDFVAVRFKFYNPHIGKETIVKFTDLLTSQTLIDNKPVFHIGTCNYEVEMDTFLDTTVRFVNAVSNTIMKKMQAEAIPPTIPWCTKDGKSPSFKIEELLEYSMIDKNVTIDDKIIIDATKILTKVASYSFLKADVPGNSRNDLITSNSTSLLSFKEHDTGILDVNVSILPESKFGKDLLKIFKKTDCLNIIRDTLIENLEETKIMKNLNLKLGERIKDYKDEIGKKIISKCKDCEPCLVSDENNLYTVNCPYITNKLWEDIKTTGLKLCPLRFIQFLRARIPMDEEDYNELYRLFNCICRSSEWKYVVGDQVFDATNDKVELFDVMAINKGRKEVYMMHVKKGFHAEPFRAVCSQVRVCGDEIWKSVTIRSNTNALEKFYECASKDSKSFRRKLTKMELEKHIGNSKEEFLGVMLDSDMQYFICLTTCLNQRKNLSQVAGSNLAYKFVNKDFPDSKGNIMAKLVEKTLLHEKFLTITGQCFVTKDRFEEQVYAKDSITKSCAREVYDIIFKKTCGGRDSLMASGSSFVAKVCLIDLHRTFSDYIIHGTSRVKLKILEIDDISKSKACDKNPIKSAIINNQKQINFFSKPSLLADAGPPIPPTHVTLSSSSSIQNNNTLKSAQKRPSDRSVSNNNNNDCLDDKSKKTKFDQ